MQILRKYSQIRKGLKSEALQLEMNNWTDRKMMWNEHIDQRLQATWKEMLRTPEIKMQRHANKLLMNGRNEPEA